MNPRHRNPDNAVVELARGTVRDQPWGLTLGALAQRAITGELTIVDGATRVVLVIEDGFLVAGTSTRNAPTLLERAARTFDLPNATYSIDDQITLVRREKGAAIDLREVVFTGARRYLDDDRLNQQLRQLGTRFSLGPGGAAELPRYGEEAPVAISTTLREGANLAELELAHPDVDRRALQAFLYALVSCGAVRGMLPARAPTPPPDASRTITPSRATPLPAEALPRTPTPNTPRAATPNTPRAATPNTPRAATPNTARTATSEGAAPPPSSPNLPRASSPNDSGALLARIPTINVARNPTPPGSPRTPTPQTQRKPTPQGSPPLAAPRTTTTKDALEPPRTSTTKDAIPRLEDDGGDTAPRTAAIRDRAPPEPPLLRDPRRDDLVRDDSRRDDARREDPRRDELRRDDPRRSDTRRDDPRFDEAARNHRAGTSRDPAPQGSPTTSRAPTPPAPPAASRTPTPPGASSRGGAPSRATPSHGVRIIAPDDEVLYRASQAADRARRLLEAHEYIEAQREALTATRLLPDSFDYQALSAWATFCGSRDKPAVADATRKLLEKASHRATAPHEVRLMLGKLERIAGREREALRHFRAVLESEPTHAEAAAQIRELEAQLEAFARR